MDDRYTGPYFINRQVGNGVYELRNAHDKFLKKVNINRLKMYTCSKDIEGSSDDKAKGEHEEFNQKELKTAPFTKPYAPMENRSIRTFVQHRGR